MGFAAVAERFSRAALNSAEWLDALSALASATNSLRAQLIGFNENGISFNLVSDLPPEALIEIEDTVGSDPRVNYRVRAGEGRRAGEIVFERDYQPLRRLPQSAPYVELCEKHALPFGCQTVLLQDESAVVGMALLRSRDDGLTTERDRALFRNLVPHVRAAVRLHQRLERQGAELLAGAMGAVGVAAVLIDPFGRAMATTPAADRILGSSRLLDIRNRALVAADAAQDARLGRAQRAVLGAEREAAEMLLKGEGERPVHLALHRLPDQEWNLGFRPRAVAVLKQSGQDRAAMLRALIAMFGLTSAEADVALHLHAGLSRTAIAERRNASVGTVRQQIKAIFAKMSVHREAEFVALLATIGEPPLSRGTDWEKIASYTDW